MTKSRNGMIKKFLRFWVDGVATGVTVDQRHQFQNSRQNRNNTMNAGLYSPTLWIQIIRDHLMFLFLALLATETLARTGLCWTVHLLAFADFAWKMEAFGICQQTRSFCSFASDACSSL